MIKKTQPLFLVFLGLSSKKAQVIWIDKISVLPQDLAEKATIKRSASAFPALADYL